MRLTVRINEDSTTPRQAFAVLWLDTDKRIWSREAHQGIDLPVWGTLESMDSAIALHPAEGNRTLCRLQGLSFSNLTADDSHGTADLGARHARGAWRVQAVDATQAAPEYSDFPYVHA